MSSSDDTFNMSAKELRKFKKKERKVARQAMLKVTPNVNISRSSQVTRSVNILFNLFASCIFVSNV
jgi:hypothetical protein